MGVIMADRRTLRRTAQRYRRATKKQKAGILDEFVATHECTRNHASWLLRSWGKTVFSHQGGQLVKIVVGQRRARRTVPRVYDQQVYEALEKIWYLYGGMCGKRLIGVLRHQLPLLEKFGEITVDDTVREKLQRISAATIDRLLQAEKRKLQVRGRSHTKPTTRLLHKVPIRTFAEWEDATVGEMGADLVGHDGGVGGGEHAFTLVLTDRVTQWTEPRAVLNKAQKWVFQALLQVRSWLPFALLGLHTDCGGEFINDHLVRYCKQEKIDFSRSRANRKNDNCFTEQKNNAVVREHVGYLRLETEQEVELLNQIYDRLRLLVNFFYPSQRLIAKTRQGARVRRRYDMPQTPYQRVLACPQVSEQAKQHLRRQFDSLNPAALQREILRLQQKLLRMVVDRVTPTERAG